MTCQEAMKFMQRYLDQDLDDAELLALKQHLEKCPGCELKFTQLKELNNRLSHLPKVAPPFSLVDAIMPQLEQINLQQKQMDFHTEQAASQGLATGTRRAKLRWSRSPLVLAVVGSSIAACLFVVLFFFNADSSNSAYSLNSAKVEDQLGSAMESLPFSDQMESPSQGIAAAPEERDLAKIAAPSVDRKYDGETRMLATTTMDDQPLSAQKFISPNGKYFGVIENQQVAVKDEEDEIIFKSAQVWSLSDSIRWVEWLDENQLSYSVFTGSESKIFVIHLEQKSETEKSKQ